ncbi:zinc-ribbon domain-containing protein [Phaeovulum sp. W22_SRMD_FR3]|uniref:zinc-ribbon domain-containing protein n=1 Tax=Phaeovulum sp. W22_SRMD_FR3 TaxID=3240274 RepID=UPI003F9BDBA6
MRLICPNCSAQYDVDDSVIPDAGRDVQCSNCGQTWFQPSARYLREAAEAEASAPGAFEEEWDEPSPLAAEPVGRMTRKGAAEREAATAAAAPASAEAPQPHASPDTPSEAPASAGATAPAAEAPAPPPAPVRSESEQTRRALDDSLLAILREEAEREARARRAEGIVLDSEPEFNLPPAGKGRDVPMASALAAAGVDSIAHLRGTPEGTTAPPEDEPVPQHRRELLPDIEEINSTLRATSDRQHEPAARDAPQTEAHRRSGFRFGFSMAAMIAVTGTVFYLFGPQISAAVPQLAPAEARYHAMVDVGRLWLEQKVQLLVKQISASGT